MSDETKLPPVDEGTFAADASTDMADAASGLVPSVGSDTSDASSASPEPLRFEPTPPDPATLPDVTLVNHMSVVNAQVVETCDYRPIRQALDLALSDEALRLFHEFCRVVHRRPPTIGELRLLDRITRVPATGAVGYRHAVGEMSTASPEVAETWADMMQKHAFLSSAEGILPPPTFDEALSLAARYIYRTGRRQAFPPQPRKGGMPLLPERVVLLTRRQEYEAAAAGFSVVARVRLSDGTQVSVARRMSGAPIETAPRGGDVILYARTVPLTVLSEFAESQCRMSKPYVGAMRVVSRSFLETAVALAGGADIYAHLLGDTSGGKLPVEALCSVPETAEAGVPLLLCASAGHAAMVQSDLKRRGVEVMAVGVVRKDSHVSLCLRHPVTGAPVSVASLRVDLLRRMQTVAAHACTLTHEHHDGVPAAVPLCVPRAARLPGVSLSDDGMTADGREWVALTAAPDPVFAVREEGLCLSSVTLSVNAAGEGYAAALCAVKAAMAPLGERAASASDGGAVSLSVSLRVREGSYEPLCEVLCGLYRAAAEAGVPVTHDLVFASSTSAAVSLVLVAWAQTASAPAGDDRGWGPCAAQGASPNAGNVPVFLFPILRRSMEGGLKALGNALGRRTPVKCALQPLIPERYEEKIPLEPAAPPAVFPTEPFAEPLTEPQEPPVPPPPLYRVEVRERIQLASAAQLVGALLRPVIPVFAMSEEEAAFVLSQTSIRDALDTRLARGGTVVVLGEACRAFAAYGYLPAKLSETRSIAAAGTAEVTYHGIMASAPRTVRLLRAPLLTPVCGEVHHLLALTLSDGTVVPDAFVGSGGRVLGIFNGVDSTLEPLLHRTRFLPDPPVEPTDDGGTPPAPTPDPPPATKPILL